MSPRPDIATALDREEHLLWQGHPKPGRPISARANLMGLLFYLATVALLLSAWWLEIYKGHLPGVRLAIYGLIGTAAFFTFVGLRVTLLDRRRARARDARTAYGITERRVIVLAGPYRTEIARTPEMTTSLRGNGIDIAGPDGKIRLDRLADAKSALAILTSDPADSP